MSINVAVSYSKANDTKSFLEYAKSVAYQGLVEKLAEDGLNNLKANTPVLTGTSAAAWSYEIKKIPGRTQVIWTNSDMAGGIPLVLLNHYGHGTRNGGYVPGSDFINLTMMPLFESFTKDVVAALRKR